MTLPPLYFYDVSAARLPYADVALHNLYSSSAVEVPTISSKHCYMAKVNPTVQHKC